VEIKFDGIVKLIQEKELLLNKIEEQRQEIENLKNEITEMNDR
jgi:hypothetical protein